MFQALFFKESLQAKEQVPVLKCELPCLPGR